MRERIRLWLIKKLLGGIPTIPSEELWKLIDEEKEKPGDEIRCYHIDAWMEAAAKIPNFR